MDSADDATFGYDGLHRLTSASGLWGSYGYVYDPLDNIRSRSGPSALSYSYDAATNRLTTVTGGVSRSYGYNSRGEITSDGSKTFTVNSLGQITSLSSGATYAYDGNGKRIRSIVNGALEYTLYDRSGALVYSAKSTTDQTGYLQLNGQTLVEVKKSGSTLAPIYLHSDLLGSPRKATTQTKTLSWQEHFDPYGKKLNGVVEKIGYTGHSHDSESGLTYMKARFYDPEMGRFLSPDPVRFDGGLNGLNLYAYVGNDPLNNTDPSGKCVWDGCVGEAILVASAAGIACHLYCGDAAEGVGNLLGAAAEGAKELYHLAEGLFNEEEKPTDASSEAKPVGSNDDRKATESATSRDSGTRTPAPFLPDDPYSPEETNKRQSETRRQEGAPSIDPNAPVPDRGAGRDMGGHEARGRTPHTTGERNVNPNEEHSRRAKGNPSGKRR